MFATVTKRKSTAVWKTLDASGRIDCHVEWLKDISEYDHSEFGITFNVDVRLMRDFAFLSSPLAGSSTGIPRRVREWCTLSKRREGGGNRHVAVVI